MNQGGLRVAVVVPAYDRATVLERTLAALTNQTYPAELLTVVVADDGSTEDLKAVVDSWRPPFTKNYQRQEHDGFGAARARNLGARSVPSDVIVFLDSDALVGPDFVSRHAAHHEGDGKAVVIGGRLHLTAGELEPAELAAGVVDLSSLPVEERGDFRQVLTRRTSGLSATDEGYRAFVSSNVSLSTAMFEDVGGFDERFRWWGSEDSELGWRLWQAGATFLEDPEARIYHQLDIDTAGGVDGRDEARLLNRGLLTSLVPQRFYRKGMPEPTPEIPKFSVLIHDVPSDSPIAWWRALLGQSLPDFEVIFIAKGSDHDPFAGASEGERRISFVPLPEEAVARARGEYLVFLDGSSAPGPTMLQNIRKRLDARPALDALTFGIAVPEGNYTRIEDLGQLEEAWGRELPLAMSVRRRALVRRLDTGSTIGDSLDILRSEPDPTHIAIALIALPGAEPAERPAGFTFATSRSRQLYEATQLGAGATLRTGLQLAKARFRPARPLPARSPVDAERQLGIRYVGWVGKDNLGDEAMLVAVRKLMGWGEVEVRGEARDLLLLGGGTLINRNQYLRWLTERDSPRIERAVFGTGVASPDFWGITEDTTEWQRWLGTCAYVGVRGPTSAQTLADWGYKGEVEVCGDSALALTASAGIDRESGSVVVAPAWTNGELWGESDHDVYTELAAAIRVWVGQGRRVTLMSCHPTDDRPILIIKGMLDDAPVAYHAGYSDVQESIDLIAAAGLVVGERLHACVLAAAVGRPFIAIEYRPKVRDFTLSVEMAEYTVRSDDLTSGGLVDLAAALGENAPRAMQESVTHYRERLAKASEIIEAAARA
jgi:GT2 family glycosyltransferase